MQNRDRPFAAPVVAAGETRDAREPSRAPVAGACPATALDGAPEGAGPVRLGDDPPASITAMPPAPVPEPAI